MRHLIFLLILISSTCLFSCEGKNSTNQIIVNPTIENTDTLKYLWRMPINDRGYTDISIEPLIFGDNILVSDHIVFEDETIRMYSTKDKNQVWEWHDYFSEFGELGSNRKDHVRWNDWIIINANATEKHAIDLNTGETMWQTKVESGFGNSKIGIFEDHVYYQHESGGVADSLIHLVRADAATGIADTIFTKQKPKGFLQTFNIPTGYRNEKGEEVLFFVYYHSNIEKGPASTEIYLIGYNVDTQTTLFEKGSLDIGASVNCAVVYENKVYLGTKNNYYCIDAISGEIVWHREMSQRESSMFSAWVVAKGKMIIKTDIETMYALDTDTGVTIWKVDTGESCSDLSYHNGVVYFGCRINGEIHAIDIETGEDYWGYKPPSNDFQYATFLVTPGIDKENELVYLCDRYYLYCVEAIK